MEKLENYSVQPILDDGSVDKAHTQNVIAPSPLKAAEEAMGLKLALAGRRARALVWHMTAGFVATPVTLYEPEQVGPVT